jgi:hypothetical protein
MPYVVGPAAAPAPVVLPTMLLPNGGRRWDRRSYHLPLDSALLRHGGNELTLSRLYDERAGLETIYLLGDSGVEAERGAADRVFLQVPEYRGVVVCVLVDGRAASVTAWEPNEMEITRLLPEGRSSPEIRIEVAGHRRNSHGPLHHTQKWPTWTGPAQLLTSGQDWSDGYQLVPCGLMKPPAIVIRRKTG